MEIKVEKKDRGTGMWLLPVLAIGALAIALGVSTMGDDRREAGLYDPDRPAVVSYEGRRWMPADRSVVLDDAQVREVGRTAEGFTLFTPTGGGGGGTPGAQFYLKAADDRYVPVTAQ